MRRPLRADDPTLPKTSPDKFLHAHNYKEFISACERMGVPDRDLFLLHDLGGITGDQGKVLGCLAVVKERSESAAAAARRVEPPHAPNVASRAVPSSIPSLSFENLPRGGRCGEGGDLPTPRGARRREPDAAGSGSGSVSVALEPADMLPDTLVIAAADDAANETHTRAETGDDSDSEDDSDSDDATTAARSDGDGVLGDARLAGAFPGFRPLSPVSESPRSRRASLVAAAASEEIGSPKTPARARPTGANANANANASASGVGVGREPLGAAAFADENADPNPNEGGIRAALAMEKMALEYERLSRAKESESARWRDEARAAEVRRATDAAESAAAIRDAEERAARATRRAEKAERRCRKAADAKDAADAALERAAEDAARREAESERRAADAERRAADAERRAADAERDAARRVEAAEAEASRDRDASLAAAAKLAAAESAAAETASKLAELSERLAESSESSADAKAFAEASAAAERAVSDATRRADDEATERARAERELATVRAELAAELATVRAERDAAEASSRALEASLADARAAAEASAATAARLERDVASLSETVRERGESAAAAADALRRQLAAIRADALRVSRRAEEEDFLLTEAVQELASRAALYERARAENRRLHNAVQDLKGSIRVFCRVRPRVPRADGVADRDVVRAVVDDDGAPTGLVVRAPARHPGKDDAPEPRAYAFDRVFGPDATQSDVYEECSALIRCVCDGYNVCFLAYGQTGSGKTHTMSGASGASGASGSDSDALGVNYRALDDLFAVAAERASAASYRVSVSVLEIYNERCVDLLADEADARVDVVACGSKTGANVPDAVARTVSSAEEVREVMREGEANRATGATAMNERSSRSHSVVIVRVDGVSADSGARTRGVLYLVDLAGSERLARSEARGERLKESQHINKSLSALGDVIGALQANSPHVPYRNSKLTMLLQGALGPSGKALCFVHVSPTEASAGETVSTLNFATRVASVELGRARKNADVGGELASAKRRAERAEEEANALRRELDEQANIAAAAARAAAEADLRAEDATRRLAERDGRAAERDGRAADVSGARDVANPFNNPFDDVVRVADTPTGSVYRPSPSTSAGNASSASSVGSLASRGSRGSSRRISTGSSGGGGFGSVVDACESDASGVFFDEEMSVDDSVSFDLSPSAGSVASGSAGSSRGEPVGKPRAASAARASSNRARDAFPGFTANPLRAAGASASGRRGETGVKDAARASALARLEAAKAAREAAAEAERREVERQAARRGEIPREENLSRGARSAPAAKHATHHATEGGGVTIRASPAPWPSPPSRRRLRPVAERRLEPDATTETETETETAGGRASPPPARSGTGTGTGTGTRAADQEPERLKPDGALSPLSALANRTLDDDDASFCDDAASRRADRDVDCRHRISTRAKPGPGPGPGPGLLAVDRSVDRSVGPVDGSASRSAAPRAAPPARSSSSAAASAWRSAFRSTTTTTTTKVNAAEKPKKPSMVSRAIAYLTPRKKKKKAPTPRWQ